MTRTVHPIEAESYSILRSLVDLSDLDPPQRAVTERVIHATGDPGYATDLVLDGRALRRGRDALLAGAPVAVDARMVAAGITSRAVLCALDEPGDGKGPTRSAEGARTLLKKVGCGAVWVVGSAPTALFELLRAQDAPAFVIGLPVGFVGALEAKAALLASGIPCIANRSTKGGSAAAAAVLNALLYLEEE